MRNSVEELQILKSSSKLSLTGLFNRFRVVKEYTRVWRLGIGVAWSLKLCNLSLEILATGEVKLGQGIGHPGLPLLAKAEEIHRVVGELSGVPWLNKAIRHLMATFYNRTTRLIRKNMR
jgi:hypothetical protein